jgi:hypothetical protein
LAWRVEAVTLPPWLQAGGRLYGLAIVDTGGGPRQRPEAVGTLELQTRPWRSLRSVLELRGRAGGPFEGGPGPAVDNFNQAFQNYSPSLDIRQGFLEWRGSRTEVRAGVQTLAWGKLDGVPPTDVVNPRDWHDPFVVDEFFEEHKVGIPVLLATRYLPDVARAGLTELRLEAAWIPWAVPARLPLALERWFPPTVEVVPPRLCIKVEVEPNLIPSGLSCGAGRVRVRSDFGTLNAGPPHALEDGGLAFRLRGSWKGADLELSHYSGPETSPNAGLQIVAYLPHAGSDAVQADARLAQVHSVMHMTGAAVARPVGAFTLRAEAAWFVNHAYLRPAADVLAPVLARGVSRDQAKAVLTGHTIGVPVQALFPRLDSVEWGIGADTVWRGFIPLLQVNQIVILGNAPRLLIANPETRLSGTLSRRFAGERLEIDLRGSWEIERGSLWVFPRVSYRLLENVWLRAGYLAITGTRNSLFGQFRDNDEVVFQTRMTF